MPAGLTDGQYYVQVRNLGLRPTPVRTVFVTPQGEYHSVPDASRYTAEQRAEIIDRLKLVMGVKPPRSPS
jgi:hypothetical protein